MRYTKDSLNYGASAQNGTYWPTLQVFAKTSLDYPNGPQLEEIHQNTLGVNLSWTLFDGTRSSDLAAQKRAEASAIDFKREQLQEDLERDYKKADSNLRFIRRSTD